MIKFSPFYIALLFLVHSSLSAQTVEQLNERIRVLEEKVRKLEGYHGIQSTTTSSSKPVQQTQSSYTPSTQTSSAVSSSSKKSSADREFMSKIIRARLFKKNLQTTGSGRSLTLLIAFTNTSRQDINAFKGTIVLSDNIGNDLVNFSIDLTKPITSLESESWFGEIPYKANNQGYAQLLSLDDQIIKTRLECEEIVFSDGSVKRVK